MGYLKKNTKMELINITEEKLNNFLKKEKYSQFLQSWQWGEFQKNLGNKIFRIGVEKDGELLVIATLIKKNIGLGKSYFYCPGGPVMNEFRISNSCLPAGTVEFRIEEVESFLFNEIERLAKEENIIFFRFEPLSKPHDSLFMIHDSIPLHPKKTLMIDLSLSEDELLKDMHKKTRYNIRLSQKKEVEIIEGGVDDFEDFWELMNKTSDRDGFRIHSKNHYRKLLELDFVKLYFAKFEGKIIALGLFSFFGDAATYMHGASSNEYRNVMAPFLLQWELAKLAKEKRYKYYDFYGIDEKKWPGVTRFKKGFGGFELEYPGTLDMVFSGMWYNGYRFLRKVRRIVG